MKNENVVEQDDEEEEEEEKDINYIRTSTDCVRRKT